jgi:hypothetical protein
MREARMRGAEDIRLLIARAGEPTGHSDATMESGMGLAVPRRPDRRSSLDFLIP